jgi:hypothetical protein
VLFERCAVGKAWLFSDQSVRVIPKEDVGDVLDEGGIDMYLFDPCGQTPGEPYEAFEVFTVVAASSPEAYYKAFYNRVKLRLFLPVWSVDECIEAASHLKIDKQTTEARFNKFGGVPQSIFRNEEQQASLLRDLNAAISTCSVDDISRSIGMVDLGACHKLLQYEAAEDFMPTCVRLTSPYIESGIFSSLLKHKRENLLSWTRTAAPPALQSVRGTFFECFAHEMLIKGWEV